MAKHGGVDVAILLVDGFDLRPSKPKEARLKVAPMLESSDGLGDAFDESTPTGHAEATLAITGGFFDDAAASAHAAFVGQHGAGRLATVGLDGNLPGAPVTSGGGLTPTYERLASQRGLTKAHAEFVLSGAVEEGVLLHPLGVVSGASDGEDTPLDNSASSPDGAAFVLQVPALTLAGFDDAVVTIRGSANGSSWSDLASFAPVATAPHAARITVAGTVPRYLAWLVDFTGSGGTPSIRFLVAVTRF